jgi:hypothetical protein
MKTITIIVDKVGQVAIQTNGFDGATCRDATKAIERGLGVVLADKTNYDQPTQQTSVEVIQ